MVAFDLQGFRSQFQGDGARPNLFEVQLNLPATGIAGEGADLSRSISFLCRAASLPGANMGVATTYYMGREFKHPGNPSFDNWTVTLYNDEDFRIRNAFERWIDALNGRSTNLRNPSGLSPDQYSVDALVMQYGKRGPGYGNISDLRANGALKMYKFIGLWPANMSEITLDYTTVNTIEEYSITFAYQWVESVGDGATT